METPACLPPILICRNANWLTYKKFFYCNDVGALMATSLRVDRVLKQQCQLVEFPHSSTNFASFSHVIMLIKVSISGKFA